jgi:hypothetical protein
LFDDLKAAGFSWETFNDRQPIARLIGAEDRVHAPNFVKDLSFSYPFLRYA